VVDELPLLPEAKDSMKGLHVGEENHRRRLFKRGGGDKKNLKKGEAVTNGILRASLLESKKGSELSGKTGAGLPAKAKVLGGVERGAG